MTFLVMLFIKRPIPYYTALAEQKDLKDKIAILNGSSKRECTVKTARDVASVDRDKLSIKCLQDMQASCGDALAAAQDRYDDLNKPVYCATCNQQNNQTSSTCMYGGSVWRREQSGANFWALSVVLRYLLA